jgi:nuclear GTP-binding protein
MKRIYLIDCPGVVYSLAEPDEDKVLKGVVRVELVEDPTYYIPFLLARVKREYMSRTYRYVSIATLLTFITEHRGRYK